MIHDLVNKLLQGWEIVQKHVDFSDPLFHLSVLMIFASPTFWNLVGRLEFRYRIMRKIFCGNKYLACYIFGIMVFTLSGIRNYVYDLAISNQSSLELPFDRVYVEYTSYALYAIGLTLVLGSFFRLGITGTYCGDYFGILMKERVTGFPFNILEDPMYIGSTLNFLAQAVYRQSVAGLILTGVVYIVYMVYSIALENPYTAWIYSKEGREVNAQREKSFTEKTTSKKNTKKIKGE